MIWFPKPTFWRGQTVFVVGGGASLRDFDFERLRGRPTIAINQQAHVCRHAAILFFVDYAWLHERRDPDNRSGLTNVQLVNEWAGLVITTSAKAAGSHPLITKTIWRVLQSRGREPPPLGSGTIWRGPHEQRASSAGHKGGALAWALGAATIVLLGFDCDLDPEGRSHAHDAYGQKSTRIYDESMLPQWRGWRAAAEERGVRFLNASPRSRLDEFERVDIKEILR